MIKNKLKDMKGKILISNGYKNFHMLISAYEVQKYNKLHSVISGYIPRSLFFKLIKIWPLNKSKKLKRITERKNNIIDKKIINYLYGEIINEIIVKLRGKFKKKYKIFDLATQYVLKSYALFAKKYLVENHKDIKLYHYRAGFGGVSVDYAKSKNIKTICDHTIAHPAIAQYMVANKGKFPKKKISIKNNWWKIVVSDINKADIILVNSNFVKKTLIFMGCKKPIKVLYTGPGKGFEQNISLKKKFFANNNINILYSGGLIERKGLNEIQNVIKKFNFFDKINFELAGSLPLASKLKYKDLLNNKNVKYLGILNREDLNKCYKKADIFLFPSLVEGSAKVIFEAMASGCAVITTPNSGSIVEHNKGGFVVKAGNSYQLLKAIKKLTSNPKLIKKFGNYNKEIVKNNFRQSHYGKRLNDFYKKFY